MSKSHQIYIFCIIAITIGVIIYYYVKSAEHKKELEKIARVEAQMAQQELELEKLRSQTIVCPVGTFLTPRSCYEDSNYTCSWNEVTKRCEQKPTE
jgi:uncharacterized protein YneF (UPF0154 family)